MKKLLVLSIIGVVLSISMGLYFDDPWFMVWFLFSIALGNISKEIDEDSKWNNGICKKYNEPWEFVETIEYLETRDIHYKCKDQHFYASPRDYFKETYKGQL